jgi:hypothetical protein
MSQVKFYSRLGPLPESAFFDPDYRPDVEKHYGPASAARMEALREKLQAVIDERKAK